MKDNTVVRDRKAKITDIRTTDTDTEDNFYEGEGVCNIEKRCS